MADTIAGGITFQGLGSGTDFGAMIAKLKAAESVPMQRMQVWRSEWDLRVSAFQDIMATMQTAKDALNAFSSMDKMLARTVDSSNPTVASATADSKIEEGIYSINVLDLARSAIFSSKQVFSGKDAIINNSGGDQTFNYTYKGETRSITLANNTSLEQLVTKINNDGQNPGVKASLVKSGSGYVFQMQGKDTGAAASLSIESSLSAFDSTPHFSGRDFVLSDVAGSYSYTYKGKTQNISITPGMTADQFVASINSQSSTMGVKASLVQNGSDYAIQFQDASTKQIVTVPASTDVAALGAQSGFTAGQVVNSGAASQSYKYAYLGKEYTLNVAAGTTIEQFVTQFNAQANPLGLNGSLDGTGKFKVTAAADSVGMTSTDASPMTFQFDDPRTPGTTISFNVADGTTMQGLVAQFNAAAAGTGLTAGVQAKGDGSLDFVIRNAAGNDVTLTSGVVSNVPKNAAIDPASAASTQLAATTSMTGLGAVPIFSGKNLSVNNSGAAQSYAYTYNGNTRSFSVAAGTTMDEFVTLFNADATAGGLSIRAATRSTGSGYEIQFTDGAATVTPDNVTTTMDRLRGVADNWYSSQATDARFTLNGWAQEFTSASNSLSEVIGGLNVTIKGLGETHLAVNNDVTTLKENIKAAVDAINSIRAKIKSLTKFDKDKDVDTPEASKSSEAIKMQSQFTWQKGAILTGNYGVQLLNTRMQGITSSRGKGFVSRESETDTLNDMFTSLGEIGISTITEESNPSFGLLTIDDAKLDAAISKDIRNVAALFSANREPYTTSTEFSVASAGTVAKAGTYKVSYSTDASGHVTSVMINGAAASQDASFPGRWTLGDMKNDAAGMAIQFATADLPPGQTFQDSIQIKSGKINEMIGQLSEELTPVLRLKNDDGTTDIRGGGIPLLIDNYNVIMKGIDRKIDRETDRITLWEKRMKAKFSRLDSLLGKYNQQLASDAATYKKLGGS